MPEPTRTEPFDVCVIGSGPAGGVLSKELAERGAKVLLIEAGREITPDEFHYHIWPYENPRRETGLYGPAAAYPDEVRKAIRYDDCDAITVDRIRALGGRSIHWNADCFRFAERDFREWSVSGVEEDWPISYAELAPYYSHVERMIGVCGTREGLEVLPDGDYLPPLKLRCAETILRQTCRRLGIPMIPTRRAVLTVPFDGRPPCHYCGRCMHGCDVGSIFSVPRVMIPKAQKTGNFSLLQNTLARELLVDGEGQVRAVSVIDRRSRKEREIRARLFAVCCATIESARLLLNSRSPQHPNGLANSNDVVGRYLGGHNTAAIFAYLEELVGTPPVNNDGALDHSYIPRFNIDGRKRDYAGGYQVEVLDQGCMFPYQAQYLKGYGAEFKRQVRFLQPGFINLDCYCKVLHRPENRVTVHPTQRDAYDIAVPVVHFRFNDSDRALWHEMRERTRAIVEAAKPRFMVQPDSQPGGFASHEVGTVRMGKQWRTSVLNGWCQAHEVRNLFVVDGSCFTTFPEKNPTLTIMALAVRTAEYIQQQRRRGAL